MPASCKGRAKRAIRLGAGSAEFTGDDFLAFRFGKIGVGSVGCAESGIPRHKPKPLGHGPLFGKAHFAKALDLDWMQGFKNHASEVYRRGLEAIDDSVNLVSHDYSKGLIIVNPDGDTFRCGMDGQR